MKTPTKKRPLDTSDLHSSPISPKFLKPSEIFARRRATGGPAATTTVGFHTPPQGYPEARLARPAGMRVTALVTYSVLLCRYILKLLQASGVFPPSASLLRVVFARGRL